jgi:hypothetical protein
MFRGVVLRRKSLYTDCADLTDCADCFGGLWHEPNVLEAYGARRVGAGRSHTAIVSCLTPSTIGGALNTTSRGYKPLPRAATERLRVNWFMPQPPLKRICAICLIRAIRVQRVLDLRPPKRNTHHATRLRSRGTLYPTPRHTPAPVL